MSPICPACEQGEGVLLGTLGNLRWFKCRACGMQFNKRVKTRKRKHVQEVNVSESKKRWLSERGM